ncbi:class I SAM-dependent methyltransferase [Streptomyces capparidis]
MASEHFDEPVPARDPSDPASHARAGEPWWSPEGGFFGPLYLEGDDSLGSFFGRGTRLDGRTEEEVDGVIRLCRLQPDDHVVDCPCGYGRHSVQLARRGLRVTGFDINDGFLALARSAASPARFVRADMRRLPRVEPADAVINMFYSFGFFPAREDDLEVLGNFRAALKPGGRFLMHTMVTPAAHRGGHIPAREERDLTSGRTLVIERRLDPADAREYGRWTLVAPDGTSESTSGYDVRIYGADEFAALCAEAGFADVSAYGDWQGNPFAPDSPHLIVVATA